ncbi:MAG: hypothetical protein AVDCRST_MAG78-3210 [uncultured Rubrobacteraceae bacterium]|uniref:Uncharacterized protein n=1 Tax=uncultured Rubrobacteraceae bacterium TaxID=349277 RepID=A0A6J4QXG2_9ACTN|nr:MAG: hypothetical protein AVDCRST_MAG78-3210 [uncultured Rubrobacteraceae bacterium]
MYEYDDKWVSTYAFAITFVTVVLPLLFRVLSGSEFWYVPIPIVLIWLIIATLVFFFARRMERYIRRGIGKFEQPEQRSL